ncbi:MAG: hypothetical protein WDZ52_10585 [Pseudohongiellaceae bacterium]
MKTLSFISLTFLMASIFIAKPVSAQDQKLIMYNSGPANIRGLVDNADLVVIGRIEAIQRRFTFYGYDEKIANQNRELEANSPFKLGFDFVDYTVRVEDVIKDNPAKPLLDTHIPERGSTDFLTELPKATIAIDTITLRKLSDDPENLGMDMMLFLSINPDGETYGAKSFRDQLYLADFGVSYHDKSSDEIIEVEFAQGLRVSDLRQKVASEVLASQVER